MKKVIFILICAFSFGCNAQQVQESSLYMFNGLYYNPAYAGTRNSLNASLIAREQWVGFDGAPSSQYFSIHSPLKRKEISIGTHMNYDRTGSREKFTAYLDLAGSIKLNSRADRLSVGLSVGLDNYKNSFQGLYVLDENDPIASTNFSLMKPNVGAGIYYYGKRHYVGLSVPTILEWSDALNNSSVTKRHLFFSAGYVFKLNSVIDLKPSTLLKYTPNAPLSFDLNLSLLLYKKVWIGALGRLSEGVGLNLAYVINERFTLGYAYDYPLNKLRTSQSGSHEIMLQFDFSKYKLNDKIYSPRYF